MSDLEDRLRDVYRAVADTVDPATILGVPVKTEPRAAVSRRIRFITPFAAAAAVILVVVLTTISVGISHGHSGRAAKTRAPAPAAAGLPAFTVVSQGSSLEVFNTGTGAAVGTLAAPAGLEFDGVASGGTSQTFLAFANPASATAPCHAYYYSFRLTAAGLPQGLTLLRSIAGSAASAIAASPGGGTYAYSAVHCLTAPPNGLIGISGQAGNHTWAYNEGDDYTFSLAATAGAKELVLSLMDQEDNWANLLLNTGSGSPTVDAASRVVPAVPYAQALAISPNGATLYACVSGDQTGQLAAYSAATGGLIRVLYKWTVAQAADNFCQVSADATGTLLLASFYSTEVAFTAPSTSLIAINPQAGTAVKLPISADLVKKGVGAAW